MTTEQAANIVKTRRLSDWYDMGRAVQLRANGMTWDEIAWKLHVSAPTAKRWANRVAKEAWYKDELS